MKLAPALVFATSLVSASAQIPKVFEGLLKQDVAVKGQIGMVMPPPEIDKYVAKVEAAARKDPEWFRSFSSQAKPGVPLPFEERLGLSKEEYNEYLALWNKRAFKVMEETMLLLRKSSDGHWSINGTGPASSLSTLRYDSEKDQFVSPNGALSRIEDIKADANSILGEWSGNEWKFEEDTGLGTMKENFALGRFAGNKYGLIVYRVQEQSSKGTRLLDKSLVVRFPLPALSSAKKP